MDAVETPSFIDQVLKQLNDKDQVKKYQENIKQVGTWANGIDASFDRITRDFEEIVRIYGTDFPGISAYKDEWVGYNARWIENLKLSRNVASEHVALLRRFDKVYLDMVESIKTDQDRLDVIAEFQSFINEKHDKSVDMAQAFLTLKRDIEDFVERLGRFIADQGIELKKLAKELELEIESLQSDIEILDKKIKDATIALAIPGAALYVILGITIPGSVIAAYQSQRNNKVNDLRRKQEELANINGEQKGLAHLKSEFDGVKPDIALFCGGWLLFAEIWPSVRSQAVHLQEHLRDGMEVLMDIRFKKEIKLARVMCGLLEVGLDKYATELENRKK